MKIHYLHPWETGLPEAAVIQQQLRSHVILNHPLDLDSVRTVAAADISFNRGSSRLFASVVLVRFPELRLKAHYQGWKEVNFPYRPGFLSFREIPVLAEVFAGMKDDFDLLLCDGQGIAHPRRFGLACHLGVLLDKPAIGCAKSRLIGEYQEPGEAMGSFSLLSADGEVLGAALRTRAGVKPIFVSPGHRVDLNGAVQAAMACVGKYRIPEPLRFAHQAANLLRKSHHV